MLRHAVLLLFLAALAPLRAGEPKEAKQPLGPAPELARIKLELQGNKVQFKSTKLFHEPVTVKYSVIRNGQQVEETRTVMVPKMVESMQVIDGKNLRVMHRDGKEYTPKELAKLLDKNIPVAIFTHGRLDPFHLEFLRDEVVLLVRTAPVPQPPVVLPALGQPPPVPLPPGPRNN